MQKVVRIVAVALFAVATVSAISSPIKSATTVNIEGSSPVPLCHPDDPNCKPPI